MIDYGIWLYEECPSIILVIIEAPVVVRKEWGFSTAATSQPHLGPPSQGLRRACELKADPSVYLRIYMCVYIYVYMYIYIYVYVYMSVY